MNGGTDLLGILLGTWISSAVPLAIVVVPEPDVVYALVTRQRTGRFRLRRDAKGRVIVFHGRR